jgi:uracil-DNA glycosylase
MLSPRCSACPIHNPDFEGSQYSCRVVPGDGPQPCRVVFIGAGPGKTEARTLLPYSGQAGQELDVTYLSLAGLRRDEVWVTNACQCWDGSDRIPADKRVKTCAANHLPQELDRCRPDAVVLMGGVTQLIADSTYRLDMVHGIPQWSGLLDGAWEGWIWPMYEPALGMRDTRFMNYLLEDFRRLGQWLEGEWVPPEPDAHETDYKLIHTVEEVDQYLVVPMIFPEHPTVLAIDTEAHGPKPFSVQLSIEPHTARMILAEDTEAIQRIGFHLNQFKDLTVVLHNSAHDLDDLERMDLTVDRFRDTMQEAFQQCSLPQGLKPLVYRLFGYQMKSWQDTVWPASVAAVTEWMSRAVVLASTNLTETQVDELVTWRCLQCGHAAHAHKKDGRCGSKAGDWKGVRGGCTCEDGARASNRKYSQKAGAVESVLTHVLRHTLDTQDAEKPYDPWERLADMKQTGLRGKVPEGWEWQWLEGELGPSPILGIANCDLAEAVAYGCSDSDWTGQAATDLERRRSDVRWQIDPADRDK